MIALSETIKLLNDDDALELFKKTLPSGAGFVQLNADASVRRTALRLIRNALGFRSSGNVQVHVILSALRGKTAGFEKVIKIIDDMVALLKEEQANDEDEKKYCAVTFDSLDDKKKALDRTGADLDSQIEEANDRLSTLSGEIATLTDAIKALDKQVAGATEQRQEEHADLTELIASNSAAKKLFGIAKNRLNKFYNPALHVALAKREIATDDQNRCKHGRNCSSDPSSWRHRRHGCGSACAVFCS